MFDSRRILSYRALRSLLLVRAALFYNAPRYSWISARDSWIQASSIRDRPFSNFDVPSSFLVDREQSRDVQQAFNDTNNYGVSFFERKPGQFDCYRKLRRLGARGVSKLVSNLTWRIYCRVRGSSVRKGRWRSAPSDRVCFDRYI